MIHIVIAYRQGDENAHHYPVGVFEELEDAIEWANWYKGHRGGKYEHKIFSTSGYGFNDEMQERWAYD